VAAELGARPLPQSVEAEASLLGAILLDASLLDGVRTLVRPDDLSRETHRAIYRAIIELAESGREPSFAAVTDTLRRKNELDAAGGPAAIVALIEGTPSPGHVRGYAAVVERTSILRRIIGAAQEMMRLALSSDEPRAAVEQAQQFLFRVSERRLHREVVTLREALDGYFAAMDEQNEQGRGPALTTGFPSLDGLLGGGLHPGDLVIVAGRPGMGKTSFALNVMRNAALHQDAVAAAFSLEMTEEDLTLRLLSSLAEIDGGRLRRGALDMEELKAISHASGELMQRQIFVEECTRLDVTDVLTHARKLQVRQGRLDLIVIDYLQLMEGASGEDENRVQELGSITRGLKAIARELEVPVVALSQLSRQIERRTGGEPKLSDLRECVTGDTRVIDADSGRLVPVKDLRPGARILAIDEVQTVAPFRVEDVWSTGVKPVFRVTSQTGRTISATANHPFLTPTGWQRLEELSRGDLVATPMRLCDAGAERPELTNRCRLLGYLAGDGNYQKWRAVGFISSDPATFADVLSIVTANWPEVVSRPKSKPTDNYQEAEFSRTYKNGYGRPYGNPLREWLRDVGVHGQRDVTKRVPAFVFEAGQVGAANFLAGYLETDGSVKTRVARGRRRWQAHFDTVSHGLALDVQALLLKLGIIATVGTPRLSPKGRWPIYRVSVNEALPNLSRFAELIPARGRKGDLLRRMLATTQRRETGPGVFALPNELSVRLASRGVGWRDQGKAMRRSTAASYAERSSDPVLHMFAASDLLWEPIRSIEPAGEEEVFDLRVPGSGNFIADGFVVHNSGALEQDADIVIFLWKRERARAGEPIVPILDVRVAKHRHGPTGDFQLYFDHEYTRFRELAAQTS
jgi:replicative DNA helicase